MIAKMLLEAATTVSLLLKKSFFVDYVTIMLNVHAMKYNEAATESSSIVFVSKQILTVQLRNFPATVIISYE